MSTLSIYCMQKKRTCCRWSAERRKKWYVKILSWNVMRCIGGVLHADNFTHTHTHTLSLYLETCTDAPTDTSIHEHTLAQNQHCEFWCGMHRTCKNTSVKPVRKKMVTRGENPYEGNLSTSILDATVSSEPNRDLPFVRHAGSGLSRLPLTTKRK